MPPWIKIYLPHTITTTTTITQLASDVAFGPFEQNALSDGLPVIINQVDGPRWDTGLVSVVGDGNRMYLYYACLYVPRIHAYLSYDVAPS
jgi:hypothetical protein